MNNNHFHFRIIISIILFTQFNNLITIIISFTNYSQSQWVNVSSPFATSPLAVNPKRSLSHPRFRLHRNLSTQLELTPHLMTTTISSSPPTTMCRRRWRRRLIAPDCGWDLTGRASQNHLPMKHTIRLLFALFIFPDPIVDIK